MKLPKLIGPGAVTVTDGATMTPVASILVPATTGAPEGEAALTAIGTIKAATNAKTVTKTKIFFISTPVFFLFRVSLHYPYGFC
jgi:hypothetical protein